MLITEARNLTNTNHMAKLIIAFKVYKCHHQARVCWRYYKIIRALPAFLAQVKAASERMNEHKEGPPIGSNSIHRVIGQLFKRAPLS